MLNIYFVFGVPLFLLLVYAIVAIFHYKSKTTHYLGLILLIISVFMTAFSFQVWQFMQTRLQDTSVSDLTAEVGYPLQLIWLPILIGLVLIIINLYRSYHLLVHRKKSSTK